MKQLFLLLLLTSCTISTPQNGQKIGRIVKLSNEGVIAITCEGELIRGGLVDGTGSLGTSFHFTIERSDLKEIAYQAFENQDEVIISYRTELVSNLFRSECSEPHFVIAIQIRR